MQNQNGVWMSSSSCSSSWLLLFRYSTMSSILNIGRKTTMERRIVYWNTSNPFKHLDLSGILKMRTFEILQVYWCGLYFSTIWRSRWWWQDKKISAKGGDCLSRKEVTGPLQLLSCFKLQMPLSCNYNNCHSSCSGDLYYPPYCTTIISAGISRLHVRDYLTNSLWINCICVHYVSLWCVDHCVVDNVLWREDSKE